MQRMMKRAVVIVLCGAIHSVIADYDLVNDTDVMLQVRTRSADELPTSKKDFKPGESKKIITFWEWTKVSKKGKRDELQINRPHKSIKTIRVILKDDGSLGRIDEKK